MTSGNSLATVVEMKSRGSREVVEQVSKSQEWFHSRDWNGEMEPVDSDSRTGLTMSHRHIMNETLPSLHFTCQHQALQRSNCSIVTKQRRDLTQASEVLRRFA